MEASPMNDKDPAGPREDPPRSTRTRPWPTSTRASPTASRLSPTWTRRRSSTARRLSRRSRPPRTRPISADPRSSTTGRLSWTAVRRSATRGRTRSTRPRRAATCARSCSTSSCRTSRRPRSSVPSTAAELQAESLMRSQAAAQRAANARHRAEQAMQRAHAAERRAEAIRAAIEGGADARRRCPGPRPATTPRSRRCAPRSRRQQPLELLALGGLEPVQQVGLHPVHHLRDLVDHREPLLRDLDEVPAAVLGVAAARRVARSSSSLRIATRLVGSRCSCPQRTAA